MRSPDNAEAVARDFAEHDARDALTVCPIDEAAAAVRASTLVVNATPLGMHPDTDRTPWPAAEDFTPAHIAYDLVYAPRETRFLREAAAQGATPIGGLDMLIGQAAAAYRQWTNRPMPVAAVREALDAELTA